MLLALSSLYLGAGAPAPSPEVYFRKSDIPKMLRLVGQPVMVGGITVNGIYDRRSHVHFGDLPSIVIGTDVVLLVERFALPALAIGVDLTTDGTTYKVRHFAQVGDGATVRVFCARD